MITVTATSVNFSSTYPFDCAPRENVRTLPLGRFARDTTFTITEKGSTGAGVFFYAIQKS